VLLRLRLWGWNVMLIGTRSVRCTYDQATEITSSVFASTGTLRYKKYATHSRKSREKRNKLLAYTSPLCYYLKVMGTVLRVDNL
jgi:hypothetical protein